MEVLEEGVKGEEGLVTLLKHAWKLTEVSSRSPPLPDPLCFLCFSHPPSSCSYPVPTPTLHTCPLASTYCSFLFFSPYSLFLLLFFSLLSPQLFTPVLFHILRFLLSFLSSCSSCASSIYTSHLFTSCFSSFFLLFFFLSLFLLLHPHTLSLLNLFPFFSLYSYFSVHSSPYSSCFSWFSSSLPTVFSFIFVITFPSLSLHTVHLPPPLLKLHIPSSLRHHHPFFHFSLPSSILIFPFPLF